MKPDDPSQPAPSTGSHFEWLDSVRGMAILWIAFFHFFQTYDGGRFPWPIKIDSFSTFVNLCAPGSTLGDISCAIAAIFAAVIQRGPEGVGVFILFSGFGLTYSLARHKERRPAWGQWYLRRFAKLFPIYWVAHLVFLISPLVSLHDPVDYRFVLSFLGDRVYPVDKMFFYLVPAWWFLGLLLELYVVYPLLFRLMQRLGAAKYLALCIIFTSVTRYLLFGVFEADGNYVQGAFFVGRLWEFAAGMVLGKLMAEAPDRTIEFLTSWRGLLGGAAIYVLGSLAYRPDFLYSFSDGLTAMGLSVILIHLAKLFEKVPGLGRSLATAGVYSYGIYLFHQPYVTYFGEKMHSLHIGVFFIAASAIIAAIAVLSMVLEYGTNRLVSRYFPR